MKALILTLCLTLLPLAFGFYINHTAPHPPTRAYVAGRCTRYCALHSCRHATQANSLAYFQLRPLYAATVRGLHAGGAANYVLVNILVYLLLLPALLVWLTYGALRNAQHLYRLRHAA